MEQVATAAEIKLVPFSSQTPQEVLKRMRLAHVIMERPLWELITEALEEWLQRNEQA